MAVVAVMSIGSLVLTVSAPSSVEGVAKTRLTGSLRIEMYM